MHRRSSAAAATLTPSSQRPRPQPSVAADDPSSPWEVCGTSLRRRARRAADPPPIFRGCRRGCRRGCCQGAQRPTTAAAAQRKRRCTATGGAAGGGAADAPGTRGAARHRSAANPLRLPLLLLPRCPGRGRGGSGAEIEVSGGGGGTEGGAGHPATRARAGAGAAPIRPPIRRFRRHGPNVQAVAAAKKR